MYLININNINNKKKSSVKKINSYSFPKLIKKKKNFFFFSSNE